MSGEVGRQYAKATAENAGRKEAATRADARYPDYLPTIIP